MIAIGAALLLLLYAPYRLSRGFSASIRIAIVSIVLIKTVFLIVWHISLVKETGLPIILDESQDEKRYYDFGVAFAEQPLWNITTADLADERGSTAHLGYFVANVLAFKLAPDDPMLLLRLFKLMLFHVGLGMVTSLWREQTTEGRAFAAYLLLGVLLYQFFYYTFRNLKDDMLLSLFMIVMGAVDRILTPSDHAAVRTSRARVWLTWLMIGFVIWIMSTIRFYLGATVVVALGLHLVTGHRVKWVTRVGLGGVIAAGMVFLMGTAGGEMAQSHGGAGAMAAAMSNIGGIFKVFVTPLPWQYARPVLAVGHTFYLILLIPALMGFFMRFRRNLDWKLYVVMIVALIVGGLLGDSGPRKRFVMCPVFVSWIVHAGIRRFEPTEFLPLDEVYDPAGAAPPAPAAA
ncbi:MAG: hypothetical protein HOP29_00060 [Phycisphaerales bacterium]|nr:hypothetical protein [Phycisphaerales bacterium]